MRNIERKVTSQNHIIAKLSTFSNQTNIVGDFCREQLRSVKSEDVYNG